MGRGRNGGGRGECTFPIASLWVWRCISGFGPLHYVYCAVALVEWETWVVFGMVFSEGLERCFSKLTWPDQKTKSLLRRGRIPLSLRPASDHLLVTWTIKAPNGFLPVRANLGPEGAMRTYRLSRRLRRSLDERELLASHLNWFLEGMEHSRRWDEGRAKLILESLVAATYSANP